MSLSPQFLDELRDRTTLSALIGKTVKLKKAGREFTACCPFHSEKTASFTVNDEKGFYHCFGCGAHGDAIRWLTDAQGMAFIDAVKQLAAAAGMEVPAPSPEAQARAEKAERIGDVLEQAARWYAEQLQAEPKMLARLAERGLTPATIAKFGIGYAPPKRSVAACGVKPDVLKAAGLMIEERDGYRDRFRGRIMIPIEDARGRIVGFAARATADGQESKYLNSPESAAFAKGELLFNLHRAAPAARKARRLIIVEGQFDAIALDQAGIAEAAAPQGSAITPRQLERAWRTNECPILLLDGDAAGRKAAIKAAEKAMPEIGPGKSLSIAMLPEGEDPDSLAMRGGRDAIEAVIADAEPLSAWLWGALSAEAATGTPEGRAALWKRLEGLARAIRDAETRAQYLAEWRGRYDATWPAGEPEEETFPDGRVADLSKLEPGAAAQVRRLHAAWLERRLAYVERTAKELTGFARSLGRRVSAGLLSKAEAQEAIWPLTEDVEGLTNEAIDAAIADGMKRGFDLSPMLTDLKCSGYPMTDFGLGERFRDRHGEDFRFTTGKGWFGWDKRHWKLLDQDKDTPPAELIAAVFETIRDIQREARSVAQTGVRLELVTKKVGRAKVQALAEGDPEAFALDHWVPVGKSWKLFSTLLAGFGRASETSGKPAAIAALARRWLTVPIERFDCEKMAINVQNGTLRFEVETMADGTREVSRRLDRHRREDLITRIAPVPFDPEAECRRYDDMLAWAQPDPLMRRYLHQVGGYCTTGEIGEHKLWFNYGRGRNGKTTTIDSWCSALGDYAGTIGIESLLDQGIKKRGDAATPDLARLGGIRMLRASEPERGAKLNTALIKMATGGEPMSVRALHRGFFDLLPRFKVLMSGNAKPTIPDTDDGIWGRMTLVPWLRHIDKPEQDPYRERFPESHAKWPKKDRDLLDKIKASELTGVFRRLIDGLQDYLRHGFVEPGDVTRATEAYRDQSDPLARFLRLCTEPDPGSRVKSSELHAVFAAWCKAAGEKEWSNKGFSDALIDKGYTKTRSDGMRFEGLRLTRGVSDFVDHEGRVLDQLPDLDADPPVPAARPPPGEDDDCVPF